MRDILLSATAGLLASGSAAFMVHRALWESADEQAKQLDELVGRETVVVVKGPIRKQDDTFERFLARRFSQWWNGGVDNVHRRLLGLPHTVEEIVEDVKGADASKSSE